MKNLVNALKAMADEHRMSVLVVLAVRGSVCVSHLQEAIRAPQPTVSRYLSILRNAGLLEAERRGQWVYYRLGEDDDSVVMDMIRKCANLLKDTARVRRIMERLDKIEQQPSLPASEEAFASRRRKAVGRSRKPASLPIGEEAVKEKPSKIDAGDTERSLAAASDVPEQERADEPWVSVGERPAEGVETAVLSNEGKSDVPQAPKEAEDQGLSREARKSRKGKRFQPPSLFDIQEKSS